MPLIVRRWYDVPVRALMVACLVAAVVGLSGRVGPTVTGLLAVYPIVMTSLMLIFQPRVGGPATAALIANTMWGLVGFSVCLFTVHLATIPLGTWTGLALSLAVSVAWNLAVWRCAAAALAAAGEFRSRAAATAGRVSAAIASFCSRITLAQVCVSVVDVVSGTPRASCPSARRTALSRNRSLNAGSAMTARTSALILSTIGRGVPPVDGEAEPGAGDEARQVAGFRGGRDVGKLRQALAAADARAS